MAVKLQLEEDIRLANDEQEAKRLSLLLNEEPETTADDFELAKKMQEQFDREQLGYAESLKAAGLVEPLVEPLFLWESRLVIYLVLTVCALFEQTECRAGERQLARR